MEYTVHKQSSWKTSLRSLKVPSSKAIRPVGYQGYTYGMGGTGPVCFIMRWDGGSGVQYLDADAYGNLRESDKIVPLNIIGDEWKLRAILDLIRQAH
ncbi:hypothetical protein FAVG1_08569 [Fusarium avenaceum]|nr:hypothetical protein FAVG1_08569 [Fusarium avenaceum]